MKQGISGTIPEWAVARLKQLFEDHDRQWKLARPLAKPIFKEMGWKPDVQTIYDALHDVTDADRETACGKGKVFESFWGGYRFCGRTCECSRAQAVVKAKATMMDRYGAETTLGSPELRAKARATMLERHGVEYTGQSAKLREKMRDTTVERYGVDNVFKSAEMRATIRETIRERYGVDNAMQSSEIQAKARATNLEKFGGISPLSNEEVKAKSRATNVERYGVEHAMKNIDVQSKTKATNLDRYGVEYIPHMDDFVDKSKATMLERYGVETALLHPEFEEKRRLTSLERFGVEHPNQSQTVKNTTKKTNLVRFGVEHSAQRSIPVETLQILNNKELMEKFIVDKSINNIAKQLRVDSTTVLKYCHQYGFPVHQSSYEKEIRAFLVNMGYGSTLLTNTRKMISGMELDFYIQNLKLAIEFNGIYWHSTARQPDKLYHRRKYESCVEQGIRLIMINEDEWNERPDVVKSRIANILGKSERGVAARKLKLSAFDARSANAFFDKHHIQGSTGTISYAIGAFEEGELVAAMAFNKQRGTGSDELIRFCTDGKSRAGIFSRMFKRAVMDNDYERVLSFADLRHSEGGVYRSNGFELVAEIAPDYRYVWKSSTWHKSAFTKKRIAERFDIDMSVMTEREAMDGLGIPRIYDCGKLKFVWQRSCEKDA